MLKAGDKAPAFSLKNQDDEVFKLSDFKGKTLVLYFYPKADTPGCTTQACGIRDRFPEYEEAGAVVVGVSADQPDALKKFKEKYALPFELVGDPSKKMIEKYGQWVEKSLYGNKYMGVQRSTFIIDGSGKIAAYLPKVQPKKHDALVLKELAKLS